MTSQETDAQELRKDTTLTKKKTVVERCVTSQETDAQEIRKDTTLTKKNGGEALRDIPRNGCAGD